MDMNGILALKLYFGFTDYFDQELFGCAINLRYQINLFGKYLPYIVRACCPKFHMICSMLKTSGPLALWYLCKSVIQKYRIYNSQCWAIFTPEMSSRLEPLSPRV